MTLVIELPSLANLSLATKFKRQSNAIFYRSYPCGRGVYIPYLCSNNNAADHSRTGNSYIIEIKEKCQLIL